MSAKRVEYHQGAVADVKSAVAWYREHSPKAASDFIKELHRATDTIRAAPERWPSVRITPGDFCSGDFHSPYIYSEQESAITVWAIAHGSRRPGYWADRF